MNTETTSPRNMGPTKYYEGEITSNGHNVVLGVMETSIKNIQIKQAEHKKRVYQIIGIQALTITGITLLTLATLTVFGSIYALNTYVSKVARISISASGFFLGTIAVGAGLYFSFHLIKTQKKSTEEINEGLITLFKTYSFPCILVRSVHREPNLPADEKDKLKKIILNNLGNHRRLGYQVQGHSLVTLSGGSVTLLRSNPLNIILESSAETIEKDLKQEEKDYILWLNLFHELSNESEKTKNIESELKCVLAQISIGSQFKDKELTFENFEKKFKYNIKYNLKYQTKAIEINKEETKEKITIRTADEMKSFLKKEFQ